MQPTLNDQDTQDLMQRPVFVDPSGRRRRTLRYIALGVCALFACYVVVFVAALLGAPVPRSALIPLPAAPAQPTQWQDPAQTETSTPAAGTPDRGEPSGRQDRQREEPAGTAPGAARESVAVTPTAGPALTVERPNTNAAPAPPGLTKHSETKPGRNGR